MQVKTPPSIGGYVFQGDIGDGAFSVVRLVKHRSSGKYYACKIVPRKRVDSAHLQARFEQEIRINQQLHHPGIVEMYDLLSDNINYYIIVEFCPNGELFQFIVDRGCLSEAQAQPLFRQVLESLQYVHSMGVSHRDIKPENLLIDQFGHVKVSDFGLSRFMKADGLVDTPCGSPCYASPECISGKPYDGVTTDVWSCGVILYAMVTGQLPWTKRNQAQLFKQIRRGEYEVPKHLSFACQDFIRGLMKVDPKKRLTIPQALEHEWMRETPAQLAHLPTPVSGVSLRMVDDFFGALHPSMELGDIVVKANSMSTRRLDFRKVRKMICDDKSRLPIMRRVKKRKEQVVKTTEETTTPLLRSSLRRARDTSKMAALPRVPQQARTAARPTTSISTTKAVVTKPHPLKRIIPK